VTGHQANVKHCTRLQYEHIALNDLKNLWL